MASLRISPVASHFIIDADRKSLTASNFMQKEQFSIDYPQLYRRTHCPGTVDNLTEHLQNITFIQKRIHVSHVVFKVKST